MQAAEAVSVRVNIAISRGAAWEKLQDFSLAHYYVPRLTDTQIVSSNRCGEGAHRRVYSGKRYIEETVIQWHEGKGFVIALHKGARPMPPFRQAEFEYALSDAENGTTDVVLSMRVRMPWGSLGGALARGLIMPVVRKNLVQVAAGLKHFYETGEAASDADRGRLAGTVEVVPANA